MLLRAGKFELEVNSIKSDFNRTALVRSTYLTASYTDLSFANRWTFQYFISSSIPVFIWAGLSGRHLAKTELDLSKFLEMFSVLNFLNLTLGSYYSGMLKKVNGLWTFMGAASFSFDKTV